MVGGGRSWECDNVFLDPSSLALFLCCAPDCHELSSSDSLWPSVIVLLSYD